MFIKSLKIYFHGWVAGWVDGWVAGSIGTKAISASNLKLKLKLTEAELGNIWIQKDFGPEIYVIQNQIKIKMNLE